MPGLSGNAGVCYDDSSGNCAKVKGASEAWIRYFYDGIANVDRYHYGKLISFSLRCAQD